MGEAERGPGARGRNLTPSAPHFCERANDLNMLGAKFCNSEKFASLWECVERRLRPSEALGLFSFRQCVDPAQGMATFSSDRKPKITLA